MTLLPTPASQLLTFTMRYCLPVVLSLFIHLPSFSQKEIKGVIADSVSGQVLPFVTIRVEGKQDAVITGMNGHFSISVPSGNSKINISYVSFKARTILAGSLTAHDTIFLVPSVAVLGEVIIRPQTDKIKRIVNTAIRNKSLHNPEMYERYQCNVYYKMKVDLLPVQVSAADSIKYRLRPGFSKDSSAKKAEKDTTKFHLLDGNNHLLLSETFSKRSYKRPQQLQETVIASRFSGLKKTYFTNLVTDVLPFHVYSDYISLNGRDYVNPVAKGWQQRYDFRLDDEITHENDTTFILSFTPREKVSFNSLSGLVYINSDGYAISHFIANTGDSVSQRDIRIEQIYDRMDGRWFPRELNYELAFKKYPTPYLAMKMNGHSIIDSFTFTPPGKLRFDKAHSVKLSDSVDLYTEKQWEQLRMDTINTKELNTYRIIDSISKKAKLEKIINGVGKLAIGRLPAGVLDIDITRFLAFNDYENTRLGLGLYTNDRVSKYYAVGGWVGYGFRDKVIKYGVSATVFAAANKDNWLQFSLEDNYQNAGNIHIHTDIDRNGFRNWLLAQVDRVREYGVTAHTQKGYWEIELKGITQKMISLYGNNFEYKGNNLQRFDREEASIGLRYAYGEKRVPFFGYYFSSGTKYPIVYLRSGIGKITSGDYSNNYIRALAAISFSKRLNRWGKDDICLEAGFIHAFDNKPFSRSFLLAAKGFRTEGLNYYAGGGFLTMRPYDFHSDGYISLMYKHDFDKYFWRLKFSKPFASLAHNLVYGCISNTSKAANAGIVSPVSGYHESGILLNRLLQMNFFNATYIYLNAGTFYHWTPAFNWEKNGVFVIGFSAGF
jgi:Family of unknown function (DUF5686)/CarboxypepD_reg-like domain